MEVSKEDQRQIIENHKSKSTMLMKAMFKQCIQQMEQGLSGIEIMGALEGVKFEVQNMMNRQTQKTVKTDPDVHLMP